VGFDPLSEISASHVQPLQVFFQEFKDSFVKGDAPLFDPLVSGEFFHAGLLAYSLKALNDFQE
jgi:hypothetical protein